MGFNNENMLYCYNTSNVRFKQALYTMFNNISISFHERFNSHE